MRARGLSQRELRTRFGAVTPIVTAHADFKAPARYDDVLDVEVSVQKLGEARFQADYKFSSGGRLIGTGYETRAWAKVNADGSIKGAPIGAEFLAAMGIA